MSLNPTTAAKYLDFTFHNIVLGDESDQRLGDKILSKGIYFRGVCNNQYTAHPRYLRIALLSLRGSTNGADTTTWGDLMINSNFTKVAPNGYSNDVIQRMNRDEYVVLFDRFWKVPAGGDQAGSVGTAEIQFYARTKKLIKWAHASSTDVRKNPLYLVMWICEAEGVTPYNASVDMALSISHYYNDVIGTSGYRPSKRRFFPKSLHGRM